MCKSFPLVISSIPEPDQTARAIPIFTIVIIGTVTIRYMLVTNRRACQILHTRLAVELLRVIELCKISLSVSDM